MKVVNLLEFLNSVKVINTLSCVSCKDIDLNVLELLAEENQFIQKIDLGVVYVKYTTLQDAIIVDGLQRLLSVSLLLHAICECYKKTSVKNDKAIEYIRKNYLLSGSKLKLRLPANEQIIYEKIVNGERLSGKEKKSSIFVLLHNMWFKIKQDELHAGDILKMLTKINIILVDAENIVLRDLYISLNNNKRVNQYLLLDDYMNSLGLIKQWDSIKSVYRKKEIDISCFFKDFFATKFNFKEFNEQRLYDYFVNYFETMLQYSSKEIIMSKMLDTARLYNDIININFIDEDLKKAFINIKMHKGEDTYAYLLNIYEDFVQQNISRATFLDILSKLTFLNVRSVQSATIPPWVFPLAIFVISESDTVIIWNPNCSDLCFKKAISRFFLLPPF